LTRSALLIALGVSWAVADAAIGQAYCALRDPVTRIYETWPAADAHRSITRTIRLSDREKIAETLPFTIHFNELGRHTLYVVLDDALPLGLVHVRSERGRYGLIEIAWSLDLEGRIVGVELQRCRDAAVRAALTGPLREALSGSTAADVVRMLENPTVPDAEALLLRSAAKTLVVTERVWERDLTDLRAVHVSAGVREEGAGTLVPKEVLPHQVGASSGFDAATIWHWVRQSESGDVIGHVVRTPWRSGQQTAVVWWTADRDGAVRAAMVISPSDGDVREAFLQRPGLGLTRSRTPLRRAAQDAAAAVKVIVEGGSLPEVPNH